MVDAFLTMHWLRGLYNKLVYSSDKNVAEWNIGWVLTSSLPSSTDSCDLDLSVVFHDKYQ